jgi:hypothetical protein
MHDEIDYITSCRTCIKVIYAAGKGGFLVDNNSLIGFAADMGEYQNAC